MSEDHLLPARYIGKEILWRITEAFSYPQSGLHILIDLDRQPDDEIRVEWLGHTFSTLVPKRERTLSLDDFSIRWIGPLIAMMTRELSPAPINEDR